MLENYAVFEGTGFRFIGVTNEVVRATRVPGDRLPLTSGGKSGASSAKQLRVRHLA
jgi:hypothetical protein